MTSEPPGRSRPSQSTRRAARRQGTGGADGRGGRGSASTRGEPLTAAGVRTLARNRLIESRLTPNAISMTGLVLNVAAAALVIERLFLLAGLAFMVGSVMDTLDGRYSRMSGKGTAFGAFLDSTLDRIEEGIVLTAVAAYFASVGDEVAAGAVVVCVIGSFMVSYTRARAEALGIECKVGFATRPVRAVIIGVGLLFAQGAGVLPIALLEPAIYALAALTTVTALQRILHVRRALHEAAASEAPG